MISFANFPKKKRQLISIHVLSFDQLTVLVRENQKIGSEHLKWWFFNPSPVWICHEEAKLILSGISVRFLFPFFSKYALFQEKCDRLHSYRPTLILACYTSRHSFLLQTPKLNFLESKQNLIHYLNRFQWKI